MDAAGPVGRGCAAAAFGRAEDGEDAEIARIAIVIIGLIVLASAAFATWTWLAGRGLDPAALEARYVTEADRFVSVAGARVRVREQGPADAPPLVLLHGFVYSLESWDGWADSLDDQFRVIRYDLLGHGLTGPDPERRYAPAERAAFLGEVLDALEIERASIAGNSLGGLVAWRFAAHNPERVDRLILVDAGAFSINGVTDEPVEAPPAVQFFLRFAPQAGVATMVGAIYGDPAAAPAARLTLVRDMMRRRGNGRAFLQHIEEFTLPEPTAELGAIEAPTLVIWGGRDRVIPPSHAPQIAAAIPNARLVMMNDLGHTPQEEDAVGTAEIAREFLLEGRGP